MATKTVKIEPGTCSPPPITADPPIVKIKKNKTKLKFKNDLDAVGGEANPPKAVIKFYDIDDKGGSAYEDFCDTYPGDEFEVLPGENKECKPTTDGDFSYTVTAEGYDPLDPVIIIEPQISSMIGGPQPFDPLTPNLTLAGIALLVGLAAGYMFGRK